MKSTDVFEGIHKGCGGFIRVYEQNSPPAKNKYLVGCGKCGDYYNTDTPPTIEGHGIIS